MKFDKNRIHQVDRRFDAEFIDKVATLLVIELTDLQPSKVKKNKK